MRNSSDATWVLRVCCDPGVLPAVQNEVQKAFAYLRELFPSSEVALYAPSRVADEPGVVGDAVPLEAGERQVFEAMKQSIDLVVSAWNTMFPTDPAKKQATNGVYKFQRVIEVHDLRYIGDLLRLKEETVTEVANFGASAMQRLKSALLSLNLRLAPEMSPQLLRAYLQWRFLQPQPK